MLSEILTSVRWGQVAVMVGVMVFVLVGHFVWGRPLQRRAHAEMQKRRLDVRTMELAASISSITSGLVGDQLTQVNSEQLAVQAAKLRAVMPQIAGPPALLQAMQELLEVTAGFGTTGRADEQTQDSSRLRLVTACLAVEQRLSALIPAAVGDA